MNHCFTGKNIDTLLHQLNGLDCTAKHQDLATLHISSTCSWLYDTDEYTRWWNGNGSFFWLQGKGETEIYAKSHSLAQIFL